MKRMFLAVSIFLCTALSFANANDVSSVTVSNVSECSITLTEIPAVMENAFVVSTVELQVNSQVVSSEAFLVRQSSAFIVPVTVEAPNALPTEVGWRNLHQV